MESYFSLGIVSGAEDAIIGEDLNGTIRFWNKGAERLLGYSQTEAVGQSIELIVPTDRLTEDADLVKTLLAGEVIDSFGTVRVNKAGLWLNVSVSISPIVNPEGIIIGASKILRDISRNADIELLSTMKSYADNTQEEIISNRTALAAATEELERSAASIIQIQKALQKLTADNLVSLESNSAKIQEATAQLEKKVIDFAAFDVAISEVKAGKLLLTQNMEMLNIAQEKLTESEASLIQSELLLVAANSHALYDQLTQLPNRRLFIDRFNQAIFSSRRNNTFSALLFLDLDNFKIINDKYGHKVGDELLIEVARRLKATIRETDTVARFGGDEFVILISSTNTEKEVATLMTKIVTEKVRAVIAMPVSVEGDEGTIVLEPQCSASIGAAVFLYAIDAPAPSSVLESILSLSDKAMYQAKKAGGNQIKINHVELLDR